jgi:hypothetical protein
MNNPVNVLMQHLLEVADDVELNDHPEWPVILRDVYQVLSAENERQFGPNAMPTAEMQRILELGIDAEFGREGGRR